MKTSLIRQFCSAIGCKYEDSSKEESSETHILDSETGGIPPIHFRDDLGKAWAHFTLREQVELLQLLLLYFNVVDSNIEIENGYDIEDAQRLIEIFQRHNFGRRQKFIGSGPAGLLQPSDIIAPELAEAVGQLESLMMLHIFDLPSLTVYEGDAAKDKNNPLWHTKSGKLSTFLKELGEFLEVPEDQAKVILTSYLAGMI